MATAFELVLNNNEKTLAHVHGDLNAHKLFYRGKCFYDGSFYNTSLADFSQVTELLPEQHKYSQDEWISILDTMNCAYRNTIPRRCKHKNFITTNTAELAYTAYSNDFHHMRVCMDAFIIFGYHAQVFTWDNEQYFMQKVGDGCVVFKKWMI